MTIQHAVKEIDAVFGVGYAKANPSLVGAVLQADALHEIDKTLVEVMSIAGKVNLGALVSNLFGRN